MTNAPTPIPPPLEAGVRRLEARWPYLVAFGILTDLLGLAALAMVGAATLASVFVIGFFMALVGVVEIGFGFGAKDWGRLFFWVVSGLVYALAGVVAIARPGKAAAVFTLMLGAGLVASGVVRLVLSTHLPAGAPRWSAVASGIVTTLFGAVVLLGWPADSLVVLGTILGVDLIFSGAGWLSLGLALRARQRSRG